MIVNVSPFTARVPIYELYVKNKLTFHISTDENADCRIDIPIMCRRIVAQMYSTSNNNKIYWFGIRMQMKQITLGSFALYMLHARPQ